MIIQIIKNYLFINSIQVKFIRIQTFIELIFFKLYFHQIFQNFFILSYTNILTNIIFSFFLSNESKNDNDLGIKVPYNSITNTNFKEKNIKDEEKEEEKQQKEQPCQVIC